MAEGGEPPNEDAELAKRLQFVEDDENEVSQPIQFDIPQNLISYLTELEEEIKMVNVQANEEMTRKHTDILRTNKVFREVSKPLGENWKPVFEWLISDLSPEQKRVELEKVEREKPFMQSYKSLMTWKEIRGEAFDIRQLIPALQAFGLEELAQKTLNILGSDKDAFLNSSGGPNALSADVAPGTLPKISPSTSGSAAAGDGSARNKNTVNVQELLDDRHLLQIAKKIGDDWELLARGLDVSSGEIAEILKEEGKTYQGCFKMLWNWRESKSNLSEALETLITQLKRINRADLVQLLK